MRVKYIISFFILSIFSINAANAATTQKSPSKTIKSKKTKKKSHTREKPHSSDYMEGVASCYAGKFVGRRTTSGDKFVMDKFTGASPVLPMRTKVKITNLKNYKVVYVEVNDRMARKSGHVIDLAKLPASWIGLNCPSLTKVKLEIVDNETYKNAMDAQLSDVVLPSESMSDEAVITINNTLNESNYQLKYSESMTYNTNHFVQESAMSNAR